MIRLVPFVFVLLWSSSFIASRVGLRHLTPLLFVAVRMVIAAAVLLAVTLALRRPWRVLAGRWVHLAVAGVLTNSVLLMTAHYAMVHIGAAPIALVQTLNPLLTALLAWPLLGEPLRPLQWLGLVLGAAGVVLIVGLAAARSHVELNGLLLTAGGVVGLCSGTLYFGKFCRGVPILQGTAVQFSAAAAACVVSTAVFETPHGDWTAAAVAAVAVERRGGVAGRDGAVLPDAGARHRGAGDGELLPGAGHRGPAGLGAAGRALVSPDARRDWWCRRWGVGWSAGENRTQTDQSASLPFSKNDLKRD